MAFSVNNISCLLGGNDVLSDVSFRIGDGEKVALVGANGSGKTTLMKIIAGMITPDDGQVALPKDNTVGYLPQEAILDSPLSLKDELLSVYEDILSAEEEMEKLAHRMAEVPHDSKEFEKISHRFDHLQHEMIRRGGYSLESEVGRISAGLGFSPSDLERPVTEFSGGWQMRILLVKLLLQNPDVLLLDEPTNHLDLESILWLEDWISSSDSELLMVSHERAFMDNLVSRIFELHLGKVTIYTGNYSDYLVQREERYEQMQRAWENQQQQINQIQRFIDKNRADNSRAAQVQSRIKVLEKMEELPLPPSHKSIHFEFPQPDRGNKEVISLENCSKSYGDKEVLEPFSLSIYRGDRASLVGLNGAGKSTLMRLLAGKEKPTTGTRTQGTRVIMEYFSQYQQDELRQDHTVLDSLLEKAPLDQSADARSILGAFLFSGDDVFKKVSVLSGGEKTRLRLARMLFSKANCLLMDEPTNHLDVASRATLEKALQRYEGALVFVSHDRVFMDRLADKVFEIHHGDIKCYPGNFSDYLRAKKRELKEGIINTAPFILADGKIHFSASSEVVDDTQKQPAESRKSREEKRKEAERRNELSRKKRPLKKEIKFLEDAVQKAETRLKEIEHLLQQEKIYTDPGTCANLVREQRRLKEQMEKDVVLWEEKLGEMEKFEV